MKRNNPSFLKTLLGVLGAVFLPLTALFYIFGWKNSGEKKDDIPLDLKKSKKIKTWSVKGMDKESYSKLEEFMRPYLTDNEVYEKDLPPAARKVRKKTTCYKCHGTGIRYGEYVCDLCNGTGLMTVVRKSNGIFQITRER